MSLIKKTIILLKKSPVGYLTVVKVGTETGAKIVGEGFKEGYNACIKIGNEKEIVRLIGKKTEFDVHVPFYATDEIGCVIYVDDTVIASGGRDIPEREIFSKLEVVTAREMAETEEIKEVSLISESEQSIFKESETENLKPEKIDSVEINTENEQIETENTQFNDENIEAIEKPNDNALKDELDTAETVESDLKPIYEEINDKDKRIADSETSEEQEMFSRLAKGKKNFYLGISDKVDELFVVYPSENKLAEAIPDSEWVKINYDSDGYYVVGRLRSNGKVAYLGYGVPGISGVKPPKVADGIANWFPLSIDGYDGYWLFFQDAETGKID